MSAQHKDPADDIRIDFDNGVLPRMVKAGTFQCSRRLGDVAILVNEASGDEWAVEVVAQEGRAVRFRAPGTTADEALDFLTAGLPKMARFSVR